MNHLDLILHFRYLILIPLMIFEGPITTFVAASLAAQKYFEINDILILSVVCNIAGDFIHYFIGRFGGGIAKTRFGRRIHFDEEQLHSLNNYFRRHGGKTLIIGKFTIAFGGLVLISAGITRYSPWKFLLYNLIAEIPKTIVLFLLGYYLGSTIGNFNRYITEYAIAAGLVVVAIVLSYRLARRELDTNQ